MPVSPAARDKAPQIDALPGQQPLFAQPLHDPRVIPFDSLTTAADRESIRARAAELERPAPVKAAKVELRRARTQRRSSADQKQRHLEFLGEENVLAQPLAATICDAPVAPPWLRMKAAAIDGALIASACILSFAIFRYAGGSMPSDRHLLPFFIGALLTIPCLYKLLWTFAGCDSIGMRQTGLRLVDFDGNPPSRERRYQRMLGSVLSILAAGTGLVWAFVDEDSLTWHDHISGTFPTLD